MHTPHKLDAARYILDIQDACDHFRMATEAANLAHSRLCRGTYSGTYAEAAKVLRDAETAILRAEERREDAIRGFAYMVEMGVL